MPETKLCLSSVGCNSRHVAARLLEATEHKTRSGGRVVAPPRNLLQVTNPLELYEDLYLTEQPYGLVCGVEIDLPAND
jgi:hypothetical protein